MGHKVNPKAYRLGITRTWNSKWFSDKNFSEYLQEDVRIRKIVAAKLKNSGVASIEIERSGNEIKIIVMAAKPGLIIGRGGAGVDQLKQEINKKVFAKINREAPYYKRENKKIKNYKIDIVIQEVKDAGLAPQVVLEEVVADIEKRIPFRRVMKQAVERVKKAGAKGVKMLIAGRLDGAEIARSEKFIWGNIPLHTLRADIDYTRGRAQTIYGAIGIKIWIYKGEVFKQAMEDGGQRTEVGSQMAENKGKTRSKKL